MQLSAVASVSIDKMSARNPGRTSSVPLVFIHGWGANSSVWSAVVDSLLETNDVYRIELPGFGAAADLPRRSLDEMLEALQACLPQPCVLIGWSLGGMLATAVALKFPWRVKALVTLASNPSFVARPQWPSAMEPSVFQTFADQFSANPRATWQRFCSLQAQGDAQAKDILKTLRTQLTSPTSSNVPHWADALEWLRVLDHSQSIAALRLPNYHIFGERDALVPVSSAFALRELHVGEVTVVSHCSHAPQLSAAAIVVDVIKRSLARLDAAPFSKQQVAQSFSKAASSYDEAAHVQVRIGEQLLRQLPPLQASANLVDLGCGTGFVLSHLIQQQGPAEGASQGALVAVDLAEGMLTKARESHAANAAWLCADAEYLPIASSQIDWVVSNLAIQWCENLSQVMAEIQRVLKPGGRFLFSTLGPQTLFELKQAWRQVDDFTHVNEFLPQSTVEQAISSAGLRLDWLTNSHLRVPYSSLIALMKELKAIGAHNLNAGKNRGLTAAKQLSMLAQYYERFREEGMLMATYDVFYVMVSKPNV